ncbi:Ankyrin repeat domain-containing protein 44 [Xylographa bjoerkii]|nr:Ankyrin repeat domain-containing protein 44 [Xylographa bjoerkii]
MLSPIEHEMSFLSQLKDGWEKEICVSTHYPGTCRWVLETPTFRDFISGAKHNNMLCISGSLGSGKSVIAKFLVDELSQKKLNTEMGDLEQSNQDYSWTKNRRMVQKDLPIVLKYFFNFGAPARSDSLAFVKAIFYQLLSQDSQLTLERELLALLSTHTVPFKVIVVDALDECRTDDFPAIQKLLTQLASISSLRVIVTSRPYLIVRSSILFTYCLDLDLSGTYAKLDVLKYITSGVKQIASRKSFPQDLIDEIISSVALKSADNFLTAKLVLQELDCYQPVRSVREVIQAIPEDFSNIYSSALERMDPLIRTQMIRALYFVMNAKSALSLPQLSALMALSQCERPSRVHGARKEVQKHKPKAPSMSDIRENAPAQLERDIQEFCSTLVTINGAEVILLHSSVRGFLEQEKQVNVFLDTFEEGFQDFLTIRTGQGSLREVHSLMAVLCLQYIFAAFHAKDTAEDSFCFADYACSFWTNHLREAGEAVPSHVGDLFKKLLCSETKYFSFWEARIGGNELLSLGTRSHSSRMAIVLSAFDLWELLGDRLRLSHYDILEAQHNPGRTLLHIAAAFNAISSIKYIWNHSTRCKDLSKLINDVKHPLSPLHRAVANDHLEAIQTLLVYASSELEFSDSLFQLVVESGRIDFFDLLISRTKLRTNENRSAMLRHAVKISSTKKIIELMDPVSVNAKDNIGNSPLYLAIGQRNISICEILLERGADPNQAKDKCDTPLHLASNNGDTSVANLLIQRGASVDRENRDGRPAIHLTAAAGHTGAFKILLDAGANIFATDNKDKTALHCLAKVGAEAIVKILLNHGTQING